MFCASAKLERKCPRGRLLEKHANHTQIAGDISLGFSVGASRVAPGLFFSGPNSSQERLGSPKHFLEKCVPFPGAGEWNTPRSNAQNYPHRDPKRAKTTPTGTPNGPIWTPKCLPRPPDGHQNRQTLPSDAQNV